MGKPKPTRLHLTHEYFVDIDELNWTLYKAPNKDRKSPALVGYFKDFDDTVRGMLRVSCINADNKGEFDDVKEYIGSVEKLLKNAITQFKEVYNNGCKN